MILKEKLKNYEIILASKSPRRQQLLVGMDIDFKVITKDVNEIIPKDLSLKDVAPYLSKIKSEAFDLDHQLPENYLLITADTVVIANNLILGKPKNHDDAIEMLKILSGNTHQVVTGVCLKSKEKTIQFSAISEVTFETLDETEINFYIDQYKPFDKAGAYGIQEWIGYVGIKKVNGSFYNVMGLPTQMLYNALKNF